MSISDLIYYTLPFYPCDASADHYAAVTEQTKNRWAWFSAAKERDKGLGTTLGTLNCLPPEIREQIYLELANICVRDLGPFTPKNHSKARDQYWYHYFGRFKWEYYNSWDGRDATSGKNIWEYSSYWSFPLESTTSFYNFRIASRTIKSEFERWLLSNHGFSFDNPAAYYDFTTQLTIQQPSYIQKVSFEVMGTTTPMIGLSQRQYDNSWLEICNELPTTLEEIWLDLACACPLAWMIIDNAPDYKEHLRAVKLTGDTLSEFYIRIARRLPHARVKMVGWIWDELSQADKTSITDGMEESVDQ